MVCKFVHLVNMKNKLCINYKLKLLFYFSIRKYTIGQALNYYL